MFNIINFPTRIGNESETAIEKLLIDSTRLSLFIALHFVNGLSDCNGQYVVLHNVFC
jgi:hypothetical protein